MFSPPACQVSSRIGFLQAVQNSGSVYVSALYGHDTNAYPGPYATCAAAQSNAVSGNTIVITDGTFNETVLGKAGVNWYLNDGVLMAGGGTWYVGATNGTTELNIYGMGSFTNLPIVFQTVTNGVARISGKNVLGTGATTGTRLVSYDVNTESNRCFINMLADSGCAVTDHMGTLYSTNLTSFTVYTSPARLTGVAYQLTTSEGNTNTTVLLRVAEWRAGAVGSVNSTGKIIMEGGYYSRNGTTANATTNVYFKGVSMVSSNLDGSASIFSNVRGTFYFENP